MALNYRLISHPSPGVFEFLRQRAGVGAKKVFDNSAVGNKPGEFPTGYSDSNRWGSDKNMAPVAELGMYEDELISMICDGPDDQ